VKPGESLPAEPGADFVRQLVALQLQTLSEREAVASQSLETARSLARDHADLAKTVEPRFTVFSERLKQIRTDLVSGNLSLKQTERIQAELERFPGQVEAFVALVRSQVTFARVGFPFSDVLVGTATSMEKILPRGGSFSLQPVREVEISLARREKESFQVLVQPTEKSLKGYRFRLGN
jgi:hypothetical protein